MPRPVLPLGNKAPWILLLVAGFLAVMGLLTSNKEMFIVGAVAGVLWLVAFPLSRIVLGKDDEPPEAP